MTNDPCREPRTPLIEEDDISTHIPVPISGYFEEQKAVVDPKYADRVRATTQLENVIMDAVSLRADMFDNMEIGRNWVMIHLGNGKFWRLDMQVIDVHKK